MLSCCVWLKRKLTSNYLKFNHPLCFDISAFRTNEKRKISIIPRNAKNPNAPCQIVILTPSGKPIEMPLTKTRTGFETHFGPKELGTHLVHVNYDNKEVPGTPIPVDVQAVVDLNKVEIRGLEKRKCTIGIIIIISPLSKKLYPYCLVLVGSRNGFERDFTIEPK